MRRPSPAFALAAIALFVALGGPAEAKRAIAKLKKGSVTSKHIKNGTVAEADVAPALIAKLLAVPPVTSASVTDGSLTAADLAPGTIPAQTPPAANTVGTDAITDGTLGGRDVGRFAGTLVDLDFGTLTANQCKAITSTTLTPVAGTQDLRDDAIVVTPEQGFPDTASIYARPGGGDLIAVVVCNQTAADLNVGTRDFRYVTFDTAGA